MVLSFQKELYAICFSEGEVKSKVRNPNSKTAEDNPYLCYSNQRCMFQYTKDRMRYCGFIDERLRR